MTIENSTAQAPAATYTHKTLNRNEFMSYMKTLSGPDIEADTFYSHIEYLNSPHGLIVLAHRDYDEVIEGFHPANLSDSVIAPNNRIEPLKGDSGILFSREPIAYNQHLMTRRSQGGLVLAAFGRMIDGGDPEAPRFLPPEDFTLQMSVHDTPEGPVFFVFSCDEENGDVVHVIHPEKNEPEPDASRRKFPTREFLLNSIGNRLEIIHATPADKLIDYPKEAKDLLEEIEMWTEGYDPNGRLIFSDPYTEMKWNR